MKKKSYIHEIKVICPVLGRSQKIQSKWKYKKKNLNIQLRWRFGRFVIATRDIEAGEVVFKEEPLDFGPNNSYDVLACVGCCR